MASVDLQEKANFARLSRLLVDKGTEALRNTFDGIHPAASLPAVLNANKTSLLMLKPRVITDSQWDVLYPPSGNPPDSKNFDVTLLTVLFRNICGLPKAGWGAMPVDTDRSMQANIVRIKFYRNEVYAHVTSTRVDNATFEDLWKKISQALLELNVPQKDVKDLKICPLGPEEEISVRLLKEWKSKEEDCLKVLEEIEGSIAHLTKITEECFQRLNMSLPQALENSNLEKKHRKLSEEDALLRTLAKHNFKGKIKRKGKSFHPGTRQWLFKKVDGWFNGNENDSKTFLITAGPGFGKSVFAAKVCENFKKNGKLAACHFCDFSDSNLRNPTTMLQSLSSQMCENVPGFKEKLLDQLKRPHEVRNLKDTFRIYLQNPLDELELKEPILVVVDGLDESSVRDKNEIVQLLEDYFPYLPDTIKVLVTSRPEISVAKLNSVSRINIANNDTENNSDLEVYLRACLPCLHKDLELFKTLAEMCEGSFLYAFHAQTELNKRDDLDEMIFEEIIEFLPEGMHSVYRNYVERLEDELKAIMRGPFDVLKMLEILVASKAPIPLIFVAETFGLASDGRETKKIINKVNSAVSCLLYVSDDMVTIFHKSIVDWLIGMGYEDHEYTVHVKNGDINLWKLCEQIFEDKVKNVVCASSNLILTNDVKYALSYGLKHLVASNIKESFCWLVDVVIMHVFLTNISSLFVERCSLLELLKDVLRLNAWISDELRARISWHIVEIELIESQFTFIVNRDHYLQSVLVHSPEETFTDNERKIAKFLLSKFPPQAIDFKSDDKTDFIPLAVWSEGLECHIAAVGISKDYTMAAIADLDGNIGLVCLPNLVELWSYSSEYKSISCCAFAPDNSFVLFGKLETALYISERKELPFFHSSKDTFTSCAFTRSGNRLVTSDRSCVVKLWDVVRRSLLSCLEAEIPVEWCSFSYSELFIIGDKNPDHIINKEFQPDYYSSENEDKFCAWNAVTLQRCDLRNKKNASFGSKLCKSCCSSSIQLPTPHIFEDERNLTWSTGTYNGVECTFAYRDQSLSVIENSHYTTIAAWNVALGDFSNLEYTVFRKIVKMIENDTWLYADYTQMIVFKIPPSTQKNSSCLAHPVKVYSFCFSPDSSKLATCTSDACINVWEVHSGRVLSRFNYHLRGSPFGCWWSEKFIIVFDVIDTIPGLSKYSVDKSNKLSCEGQTPLIIQISESFYIPTNYKCVDFSEGLLIFKFGKPWAQLFISVNESGGQQLVSLPLHEPLMKIEVSPQALFVFGMGKFCFYIWKKSKVEPSIYELFFSKRLSNTKENVTCCFSKDSKIAVVEYRFYKHYFCYQKLEIIDLGTGGVNPVMNVLDLHPKPLLNLINLHSKMFCFNDWKVVIAVTYNSISVLDMDSGAPVRSYFHIYLTPLLRETKLAPNQSTLAFPTINGDMKFVRLSFSENALLSRIRHSIATQWNDHIKDLPDFSFLSMAS